MGNHGKIEPLHPNKQMSFDRKNASDQEIESMKTDVTSRHHPIHPDKMEDFRTGESLRVLKLWTIMLTTMILPHARTNRQTDSSIMSHGSHWPRFSCIRWSEETRHNTLRGKSNALIRRTALSHFSITTRSRIGIQFSDNSVFLFIIIGMVIRVVGSTYDDHITKRQAELIDGGDMSTCWTDVG